MSSNDVRDAARDYGTGLVLFGILDVTVGVLYLAKTIVFLVLSLPGITALPVRYGRTEVIATALAASPGAVFFLAIGFGSIVGRRWARSLSVAFSAVWLAVGTAATAFLFACLPRFFAALRPLRDGSRLPLSRELVAYVVIAAVGVILPGVYFLFYRSAGVKAECERRDPEDRWSDHVPAADLSAAVILATGALLAFGIAFSTSRQRLFFGTPLGGGIRTGVLAISILQAAAAWGICRRDLRAWPAAAAVMAIRTGANLAIARRFAGRTLMSFAADAGPLSPDSRAAIERLEPLRPLQAAGGFVAALSIGAFLFVLWAGLRAFRGASRASRGAG
ncbi:MAG TPA: hypothetical protein VFS34_09815 [Thermoanaerobaculia bacterium]|nr:hypothetical protein [Thermoanaerobaculia bacterium]